MLTEISKDATPRCNRMFDTVNRIEMIQMLLLYSWSLLHMPDLQARRVPLKRRRTGKSNKDEQEEEPPFFSTFQTAAPPRK
mmetsp:Transcript_3477/g.5550  ORF Transcript_3477/g.5550 Transcript_3477/m.5550 type:complete len:81 (-) Transcript_3477:1957-2199(-)